MLNTGFSSKLAADLASDVTATTTSFIESGLSISLSPNTAYIVDCVLGVDCDTDGIRFSLEYDGTAALTGLVWSWGADHQTVTVDTPYTYSVAFTNAFTVRGYLKTSTGGFLHVQVRKNTDLGADTTVTAGSYLVATPIQ
jgi:hypothetical protein